MVELGLTENEFWKTSPEVFAALVAAWEKRTRRESERFAAIMALFANCHRSEGTPAFTMGDFLRSPSGRKRRRPRVNKAAVAAFFDGLVARGAARKEDVVK